MRYKLCQICHQNRYSQLDAESIMDLASESTDVKLLPSSKNYDLFTSYDEAGDLVCNGEVVTLGKARYANIKYWCGDFISSNNNIIESKDTGFLRSKYLYYFLSYTAKDYYVEATTYPKFDQKSFDNHFIDVPDIEIQDARLEVLDSLSNLIQKETLQLTQLEELTKSRFIELFGDPDLSPQKAEWQLVTSFSRIVTGTTPATGDSDNWDGDILWVTPAEIEKDAFYLYDTERKITEKGRKSKSLSLMPIGTVILSTRAPIGKVAIVGKEMTCNQGFKNFVCKNNVNPVYLYFLLKYNTDYLNSIGSGTTFKEVSKSKIEALRMPIPNKPIQDSFAQFVMEVDKLKFNVQKRIEKYKELLNKKMDEYFN